MRVDHTDDSPSAGVRSPTLLEDFHAREKVTHFDHERIPERVVHARGAGAYGFFEAYDDTLRPYTTAEFLTSGERIPVFVRFSTVAGSRGSAGTVRDTLWDFVSLQPETLHMIMWLMSDRALPRGYRMMQGFGVHTFRLVNAEGKGTFVKFHWQCFAGHPHPGVSWARIPCCGTPSR